MMNYLRVLCVLMVFLLCLVQTSKSQQRQGQRGADNGGKERSMGLKIKGRVLDEESKKPLEYATVTLFNQKDSTLVTGSVTDKYGIFEITAQPGRYILNVQFISYQLISLKDITLNKEAPIKDIGTIRLSSDTEVLAEVEVRAEKSELQLSLDKKIFNVGKDLANAGGSAADILDNIPSVSVDIDGNVSLRGSQNVRILVDGKPSGLVGLSSTDALRQLQGNLIDKVEVITNPSVRYEAEGMSGIINIVLKKENREGVNGALDLNVGYPNSYGAALNFNYRREKMNLFMNYGFSRRENPGSGTSFQEFFLTDSTYSTDRDREHTRGGFGNNIRLGMDLYLDKYSSLTGSFMYRISKEDNDSRIRYRDFDSNRNLVQTVIREEQEEEDEPNLEYSLNYNKKFAREGQVLTADLQFQKSTEEENADFVETTFGQNNLPVEEDPLRQRSGNKEGEETLLLKTDYIHPFGKKGKFEAGYRGSFRRISNDYVVEEFSDIDGWINIPSLTNHFIYNEDIHAAYALVGNEINKFSYQVGLRVEISDVVTELEETNEVNDRIYSNLFPSTHFTYTFNKSNSIQWSYSRRLRRPRFWDLNPFFTFSDSRNQFGGNPNLDPEFTNSFEVSYIRYWDKSSLSSSVYYQRTNGVIQRISTVDDEGISVRRPENLSNRDSYGFEFVFSKDLLDWWKVNGSANFFRAITDGGNLGSTLQSDTYSWTSRISSRMTFAKKVDFQLRFNYRAPQETPQGRSKGTYYADLGLSRDILKNKATVQLNVRDLFNSRKRISETFGENFYSESEFQWRSRQITLSFSYRLNQKKKRESNRNRGDFEGDGGEF
ncbi:outer membrane beta-barrel family protein [Fulvivirgaceae bacterium BMA10]|uniref:Outer membrane beta-barrel family protein n=1 Tax=Splendidivirga corallicola TaxID=3051826 RepID=A0ABT8KK01_9BACT|nr:outer membrane beta-barrel family protein [Fulvivirgaceae bacterium BMA10]